MGRKPSKPGAIPRFRARRQKSGRVLYYYDHGGKPRRETPLGADYGLAIKRWADLEHANAIPAPAVLTFKYVADQYMAEVATEKAARTLADNRREVVKLVDFFNDPPGPLDAIEPVHVRAFMRWRGKTAKIRANREKALLSHIWNYARDKGYTAKPNPCAGIKGFKEAGRDAYVEEADYLAIWDKADPMLRDAMDLAYYTGQRPADVLRLTEHDVRDGALHVRQGKTGAKLRIEVTGELVEVLARARARKAAFKVHSTRLIVGANGRPIGTNWLARRWAKACGLAKVKGLQFRDLRAKAATDKAESSGDIRQAQKQLGHTTVTMTEAYTRKRKGDKVTPTR